ncbi:hypothetical protein V6N11_027016 [Hibiscus sabdariffa]|uniref:non-specific serine/threonine protein kinase n=1 Tax=Hibiscus sabdariffa TaxID=183260 RepID=A0ABR2PFN8_9ROSI
MEKDCDPKLNDDVQGTDDNSKHSSSNAAAAAASKNAHQRSKSFSFRAPQENFSIQDFDLGKIYGVGSYSKVVRAKKKDTGMVYALKIMDKKFITKENKTAYVKLERIVLDQLDHPGVVRLYFTFQDTFSLYMALESCEGGELFDQITRKGRLSEDEACFYTAEVVDALEYIHNMGLIHRDIKPENLLLSTDGHVKIADFGSVKPMKDSRITILPDASSDDKACTFVGTAAYVPPEVLNSSPATFGLSYVLVILILSKNGSLTLLQDLDPSRRPGAGPDGYAALKEHPFFKRIEWSNLRAQTPPKLALDKGGQSSKGNDHHDSSRNPNQVRAGSPRQNDGNIDTSSQAESSGRIPRTASIESFDSKCSCNRVLAFSVSFPSAVLGLTELRFLSNTYLHHLNRKQFLDEGESVLMISMVKKLQKLSSKKVQLILTNKPKLIYVNPAKLVVKDGIIWSDNSTDLSVQVTSPSHFKIVTPKKVLTFEDPKQRALQWKGAVESLQNRVK